VSDLVQFYKARQDRLNEEIKKAMGAVGHTPRQRKPYFLQELN